MVGGWDQLERNLYVYIQNYTHGLPMVRYTWLLHELLALLNYNVDVSVGSKVRCNLGCIQQGSIGIVEGSLLITLL